MLLRIVYSFYKKLKIGGRGIVRVDKLGVIHVSIGKLSFDEDKLYENIKACMDAVVKAKPASLKGTYLKKFVISTTMGPGVKIDNSHFTD